MVKLPTDWDNDQSALENELGLLRKYANDFLAGPWSLSAPVELLVDISDKVQAARNADNSNVLVNRVSEAAHLAYLAAFSAALKARTDTDPTAEAEALLVYVRKQCEAAHANMSDNEQSVAELLKPKKLPATEAAQEDRCTELVVHLVLWAAAVAPNG